MAIDISLEGPVSKAVLEICDSDGTPQKTIQVGFNPTEYTISRQIKYENSNGLSRKFHVKDLNFMKETPARLSVSLIIDDDMNLDSSLKKIYQSVKYKGMSGQPGSVWEVCRYLAEFMHYQKEGESTPLLSFCWGEMRFIGKLLSMDTSFILFHRNGNPARARLSLTILGEEYDFMKGSLSGGGANPVKNAASGSGLNPRL